MTTNELVDYAMKLADLQSSAFVTYTEKNRNLNEAYKKIYQRLINFSDKSFLKKINELKPIESNIKNASCFRLPRDFFQLHAITTGESRTPLTRISKGDMETSGNYDIVNDTIVIYNAHNNSANVEYYPQPVELTLQADYTKTGITETPQGFSDRCYIFTSYDEDTGVLKLRIVDVDTEEEDEFEFQTGENVTGRAYIPRGNSTIIASKSNTRRDSVFIFSLAKKTFLKLDNSMIVQDEKKFYILTGDNLLQEVTGDNVYPVDRCNVDLSFFDFSKLNYSTGLARREVYTGEFTFYFFTSSEENKNRMYTDVASWMVETRKDDFTLLYSTTGEIKDCAISDNGIFFIDEAGLIYNGNKQQKNGTPLLLEGGCFKTERNLLTQRLGRYSLTSVSSNMSLDFPQNILYEWIAYSMALSWQIKQAKPNIAVFQGKLDEIERLLRDSIPRDVANCVRIGNVYGARYY